MGFSEIKKWEIDIIIITIRHCRVQDDALDLWINDLGKHALSHHGYLIMRLLSDATQLLKYLF